jgi:hypothetical protein
LNKKIKMLLKLIEMYVLFMLFVVIYFSVIGLHAFYFFSAMTDYCIILVVYDHFRPKLIKIIKKIAGDFRGK